MSRIYFFTLFLLSQFVFFELNAQDEAYKQIFESREVYFYGFDFSDFKLANVKRANEDLQGYLMAWNSFFTYKAGAKDLKRWLRKDTVYSNLQAVEKINAKVDNDQIVSLSRHEVSVNDLQKHVEKLEIEEKEGLGLVAVVECFEKAGTTSSAYFLFFDISTREILMAERVHTDMVGKYGLTQYWGTGLVYLAKAFIDQVYLPKKKMHETGNMPAVHESKIVSMSEESENNNHFTQPLNPPKALTKNDVYASKRIVFYGYDFSLFKLYDTENRHWPIDRYMFIWIARVAEEVPGHKIEKWLGKDKVVMRHEVTLDRNKRLDFNTLQSHVLHKVSIDDMAEQVNALEYEEKSGIGFIIFWECFNRPAKTATGYFVFFDIHSHQILDTFYMSAFYESKYNQLAAWDKNQYFAFKYFAPEYRKRLKVNLR